MGPVRKINSSICWLLGFSNTIFSPSRPNETNVNCMIGTVAGAPVIPEPFVLLTIKSDFALITVPLGNCLVVPTVVVFGILSFSNLSN